MVCGVPLTQLLNQFLHEPHIYGMLMGALAAARVDYVSFKNFPSADAALEYNWKIAGWRWFQGALVGLITANVIP